VGVVRGCLVALGGIVIAAYLVWAIGVMVYGLTRLVATGR
jgi:hypothetical protein